MVLNQYSSELELLGIDLQGKENAKISNGNTAKLNNESTPADDQRNLSKEFVLEYHSNTSILNSIKSFSPYFKGNVLNLRPNERQKRYIVQNSLVTDFSELDIKNAWEFNASPMGKNLWSGIDIPYDNDLFDSVLGVDILQHCARPAIFLKEINRVMKKQGVFFFTIPYLYPLDETDKNRYTIYSLKKELKAAGFVNTEISATGGWHASMAQMLALWATRSSLSNQRKKIVSVIVKPVIKYLLKLEKYSKVDLKKRPIVTGLCGVTFKA